MASDQDYRWNNNPRQIPLNFHDFLENIAHARTTGSGIPLSSAAQQPIPTRTLEKTIGEALLRQNQFLKHGATGKAIVYCEQPLTQQDKKKTEFTGNFTICAPGCQKYTIDAFIEFDNSCQNVLDIEIIKVHTSYLDQTQPWHRGVASEKSLSSYYNKPGVWDVRQNLKKYMFWTYKQADHIPANTDDDFQTLFLPRYRNLPEARNLNEETLIERAWAAYESCPVPAN